MFEFLELIAEWFNSGIYTWFEEAMTYVGVELTILWFKLQLEGLRLAWGIAQGVIGSLGISQAVAAAWGGLPSDVASTAAFFRLPEAFNIMLTAGMTRLVMSLIPGL